jgi:hypothetical protein
VECDPGSDLEGPAIKEKLQASPSWCPEVRPARILAAPLPHVKAINTHPGPPQARSAGAPDPRRPDRQARRTPAGPIGRRAGSAGAPDRRPRRIGGRAGSAGALDRRARRLSGRSTGHLLARAIRIRSNWGERRSRRGRTYEDWQSETNLAILRPQTSNYTGPAARILPPPPRAPGPGHVCGGRGAQPAEPGAGCHGPQIAAVRRAGEPSVPTRWSLDGSSITEGAWPAVRHPCSFLRIGTLAAELE